MIRRYLFCILVLSLSLFQLNFVHAKKPVFKIDKGRIDAVIEGESLRQVLDAVSKETGIVVFVDQSLLSVPLSVRFQGLSVEEGLKKIVGAHSYAMVFSADRDEAGNHRVKAVRVYPKGKPDQSRYVMLNPSNQPGFGPADSGTLTSEEIEAILERNEHISKSHVAQKIAERKNGKQVGNTPGHRSVVNESIYRTKRIKKLKTEKVKILARKHAYERETNAELQQKKAAKARGDYERNRQEALRLKLLRDSIN